MSKRKAKEIGKPRRGTGRNPNHNPMDSQLGLAAESAEDPAAYQWPRNLPSYQIPHQPPPFGQGSSHDQMTPQHPGPHQLAHQPAFGQYDFQLQGRYSHDQMVPYGPSFGQQPPDESQGDPQARASHQYAHVPYGPSFGQQPPDEPQGDPQARASHQHAHPLGPPDTEEQQPYDNQYQHYGPPQPQPYPMVDILRRAQIAAQGPRPPIVPGAAQLNQPAPGTATQSQWRSAYTVPVFQAPRPGESADPETGARLGGVIHAIRPDRTASRRRSGANVGGTMRRTASTTAVPSSSHAASTSTVPQAPSSSSAVPSVQGSPPPAPGTLVTISTEQRKKIMGIAKDELRRQMFVIGTVLENNRRDLLIQECLEFAIKKCLGHGTFSCNIHLISS
ncbi:hypothetical protein BJ138DRAFT_1115196 [Hygrophoropsis aurantiaca]|uniref:Uncharacterized protein n=1 Tax=Hygrophoropsis aurantiaca TaxID=72124 RepID=A0ACB8A828_9AGAM|nr:hypothetical protein BJ138DRAFT_1115196 [Hygrophoropsis aurantiaca]